MTNNRILTNELLAEDTIQNIRPEYLEEYIGGLFIEDEE